MFRFLTMEQVKKIGLFLGCIILITMMYGCSEKEKTNPVVVLTISTDKTSIKANNKDRVFFSVAVDGNDMTSSVAIIQKNKNEPVDEMSFSTDSAATYTFYAIYKDILSNEISIEATDLEVILTADKQTIKANDKDIVTFSVQIDGEDVTADANIIEIDDTELDLEDSFFFTKTPGIHTFYAMYNGKKSSEIQIDASAIVISLSVDKTSINANNWDKATFIVTADDENVTSSAVIMQKIVNTTYKPLDNNEFFTDEATIYSFYADYAGKKSNVVDIEATYVELAFLKGYNIVHISSTVSDVSPKMTEVLKQFQQSPFYTDRIHVITLHPFGKYCNSELAGALSQTAITFFEQAYKDVPYFQPVAFVDLHANVPSYVSTETTKKYLSNAIDRATAARDWASLTGMAVESKMNGNTIDFFVKFKTMKTDNYRFFAFIVEDGVVHRQAMGNYTRDDNYIHDNLATYQLVEGNPFLGVSIGTITAGRETARAFSINTNNFQTGRNVNFENCRIVCYTLRSNDGQSYFVDNVTTCPVNGSMHYLYERE